MVDRTLRELDRERPEAIRAFLGLESPYADHTFLRLLVSPELADRELVDRFAHAYKLIRKLVAHAWGSPQKRRNLEALAADPVALAAIQGAAARGADVPMEMLAVLVMDGSAASVDALVPHFDPALVAADDRLDRLKSLNKFAGTSPAIQAIFAEVTSTLDARQATSPALALGPIIGIGAVTSLSFDVRIGSKELNRSRVPWIQGSIDVDSRNATWFSVWLGRVDSMSLGGQTREHFDMRNDVLRADTIGLGPVTPAEVPAWLKRAAKTLDYTLELGTPRTNLRGKKRERLVSWLRS